MARRNLTIDDVKRARTAIESRGEYPSEGKIALEVGFGSDATVHKLNTQILESIRKEEQLKAIILPLKLVEAFEESVKERFGRLIKPHDKAMTEMKISLTEAVVRAEALREQKEAAEKLLADSRSENQTQKEALGRERSSHAARVASLEATIKERSAVANRVTKERDKLLAQVQKNATTAGKKEEAYRSRQEELRQCRGERDRARREVEQLSKEIRALHKQMSRLQEGRSKGKGRTAAKDSTKPGDQVAG